MKIQKSQIITVKQSLGKNSQRTWIDKFAQGAHLFIWMLVGSLALKCLSVSAEQPSIELKVKPKQCVSLKRGQSCYTKAVVSWQSEEQGNYCVVWQPELENLGGPEKQQRCFSGQKQGRFKVSLKIQSKLVFRLVDTDREIALASAELEYFWVYNKSKRPQQSWRLY